MKRMNLYIATGALAVSMLSSCTKDFLVKEPISDATPEKVSAEPLLKGAYQNMYDEYYTYDYVVNGDVQSDNAYAGGDNANIFAIDKFTMNASNANLKRDWRYLYADIKNCNIVLDAVANSVDKTITEERRQQILGEASFLRAWHYFNLIRTWKEVPIVDQVKSSLPDIFPSKSSTEAVYAFIIKDLEYSLERISDQRTNKAVASKGAVYALLAKVYAQKPNPDYAKVLEYCKEVEKLGYDLTPNFSTLFAPLAANNIESIWETTYDGKQNQNWMAGMNTPFMWGDWKKFNIPSHEIVKAFTAENDSVRGKASLVYVTPNWNDDYWTKPLPVIGKYTDADGRNTAYRLRYADILLLRAEALVELNQLDNSVNGAQYYINKVRTRAILNPTPARTQAELRLAVEKERQLELAFEGHRMFDLIRTKRAVTVMNAAKDGNGNNLNYGVTEDKLYWPISQDEIDTNPNINK